MFLKIRDGMFLNTKRITSIEIVSSYRDEQEEQDPIEFNIVFVTDILEGFDSEEWLDNEKDYPPILRNTFITTYFVYYKNFISKEDAESWILENFPDVKTYSKRDVH